MVLTIVHLSLSAFLLLPKKKRGQAKMLPYALAGARPLLPEAALV